MRQLFTFYLVLMLLTACNKSTPDNLNNSFDLARLNLKGKVKSINTKRYTASLKFEEVEIDLKTMLRCDYEEYFVEDIGADKFLHQYLTKNIFESGIYGGSYWQYNVFFDYNLKFDELGRVTTVFPPKDCHSLEYSSEYDLDSIVFKYSADKIIRFNSLGEKIKEYTTDESNNIIGVVNNFGTVNRVFNKSGLLKKSVFTSNYTHIESFETNYHPTDSTYTVIDKEYYFKDITYNFIKNIYIADNGTTKIICEYTKEGKLKKISTKGGWIDFKYNVQGDIVEELLFIKDDSLNLTDPYKVRKCHYTYDDKNNWVEQKEFSYKNRSLDKIDYFNPASVEVVKREIEYYNEY